MGICKRSTFGYMYNMAILGIIKVAHIILNRLFYIHYIVYTGHLNRNMHWLSIHHTNLATILYTTLVVSSIWCALICISIKLYFHIDLYCPECKLYTKYTNCIYSYTSICRMSVLDYYCAMSASLHGIKLLHNAPYEPILYAQLSI